MNEKRKSGKKRCFTGAEWALWGGSSALILPISWLRHSLLSGRSGTGDGGAAEPAQRALDVGADGGGDDGVFSRFAGLSHSKFVFQHRFGGHQLFGSVFDLFRSSAHALAYAANDVGLIVLWTLAMQEERRYGAVVVCFAVLLVNDVYGLVAWRRMTRRQAEENAKNRGAESSAPR